MKRHCSIKLIDGLFIAIVLAYLNGCGSYTASTAYNDFLTPTKATLPPEPPQKVALLLPLQGKLTRESHAIQTGFISARDNLQFGAMSKPEVNTYETSHYQNALPAYQAAITQGADFVVGPLDKSSVQTLSQTAHITSPTLALNYLDNKQKTPPLLYQFGLSPQDEARQAADRMWRNGHRSVIVIVPTGVWGKTIANAFQTRWQMQGGRIADRLAYTSQSENLGPQIASVLQFQETRVRAQTTQDDAWHPNRKVFTQRRQDIDAIFLIASPALGRQIRPLLKFYDAGRLPVYATSYIYSGIPNAAADRDMDGIMFCDIPWVFNNPPVISNLRNQLAAQHPNDFQRYLRLYALGVDAYQLTLQLNQLTTRGASITGATGTLYIDDQRRILRQLQWAQFQNGVPVVLPN